MNPKPAVEMKTRIGIGCLLVLLCSACQSGQEKKLDPYELIITPRNENLPEIEAPANLDKIGGFRNLKLNAPLDMLDLEDRSVVDYDDLDYKKVSIPVTEGLPRAYLQGEKIQLVEIEFVRDTLKAIKVSLESHEPFQQDFSGDIYLGSDLQRTLTGVFGSSMGPKQHCIGKVVHHTPKQGTYGQQPDGTIRIPPINDHWAVIEEGSWWTDNIRLDYCYLVKLDQIDSPLASLASFKIWVEYISVDALDELEDIHVEIGRRELERERQQQEEGYRERIKRRAGEL